MADIVGFGQSGVYVSLATGGGNFAPPVLALNAFGASETWTSQNTYPRLLADVNGDGRADIVGFGSNSVYTSLATGGGNFGTPNQAVGLNSFSASAAGTQDLAPRALGDVNGDGQADIVGFLNAGTYVAPATGGGNFAAPSLILPSFGAGSDWTGQNAQPRLLADVNGDGKADIVGFGSDGVYVSLATGGGNFAPPTLALSPIFTASGTWTDQNTDPRMLADVNGDGMADIIGFGDAGAYVSLATGGGNFAAPFLALNAFGRNESWTSQDAYPRMLADVNGDGMADIVGFGQAGVYVSLATGGGNFAAPFLALNAFGASESWTSQDHYPRFLADVNGDGMADIVGFGDAGPYVSLATGGGHFAAPFLAANDFGAVAGGWGTETAFPRTLADINGDGRADIVGFGDQGVYYAMAQPDGSFGPTQFGGQYFGHAAIAGGWTSQDALPRLVADVTGDHHADIIGLGSAGVYFSHF